jgi:hypothetical protein
MPLYRQARSEWCTFHRLWRMFNLHTSDLLRLQAGETLSGGVHCERNDGMPDFFGCRTARVPVRTVRHATCVTGKVRVIPRICRPSPQGPMSTSESGPAHPAMETIAARLMQIARQMRPGIGYITLELDYCDYCDYCNLPADMDRGNDEAKQPRSSRWCKLPEMTVTVGRGTLSFDHREPELSRGRLKRSPRGVKLRS